MAAERVSADDLALAASWLREYNDGDPCEPNSDTPDEAALTMFRVAAWLEAEVARREAEAHERALVRQVAARYGRKASDPQVRAAVRRHLDERKAQQ